MLLKEKVPHESTLDSTLALSKEGYMFIKNRAEKYQSDLFETRLLGEKVICMTGEEAVKIFYDSERFRRNGAAPKRIQKTLFGENAIQALDGEEHLHRKQLFMSLTGKTHQKRLGELVMKNWQASAAKWESMEKIVLFDEAKNILCRTACQWAGIPLKESEINKRAEDFNAMVYSFGTVGPQHWKGRRARGRAEEWIKGVIEDVGEGSLKAEEGSPLYAMALQTELDGNRLDAQMASVELINLLRSIVAISTFITFAALALHEYPENIEMLRASSTKYLELFAQEVRRYYPFAPFLGARVRKDFTWRDCHFKEGMLVVLDIYGTNHDSRIWENPYEFMPERFERRLGDPYNFIPQGGGNPAEGHRCPGEGITLEIMKASIDFLINRIEFQVPKQNLSFSLAKIPTLPESGFIIANIKNISAG